MFAFEPFMIPLALFFSSVLNTLINYSFLLEQGLATVFCDRPNSKYFCLCSHIGLHHISFFVLFVYFVLTT